MLSAEHTRQGSAVDVARQVLTGLGAVTQAVLPVLLARRFRFAEPPPEVISPAGWTFTAWLPIYAGSLVYAVDQARPAARSRELVREVGWPLAGALLANGAWAPLVLRRHYWSAQAALLCAAGWAELARRRLGRAAARTTSGDPLTRLDRGGLAPTVGMLAAWSAAAGGVNLAALLVAAGPVPAGQAADVVGGAILLGLGTAGAAGLSATGASGPVARAYAATLLWALAGVADGRRHTSRTVAAVAAVAALPVVRAALRRP